MPKYGYSYDQENYVGAFATIDEALDAATLPGCDVCWICECGRPPAEELVSAGLVLQEITSAEEYCVDAAEGWPNATREQCQELTDALRRVIGEWLDKHRLRELFYVPTNIRRYEFRDGEWCEAKEGT